MHRPIRTVTGEEGCLVAGGTASAVTPEGPPRAARPPGWVRHLPLRELWSPESLHAAGVGCSGLFGGWWAALLAVPVEHAGHLIRQPQPRRPRRFRQLQRPPALQRR